MSLSSKCGRPARRALFLALACSPALAGCGGSAESEASAASPPGPSLLVAETATVAEPLSLPSQLYTEHDAWVVARATGVVETLLVDLGSEVRSGDLLAQLEQVEQSIAMQQAEVAYESARREAERVRQLAQTRLISPADSEKAELEFRRADLDRQQARRNLELTRVTAPFSGVVAARSVRPGHLVNVRDSLFRLTSPGPLRAAVHVPEAASAGIRVGSVGWVTGVDGGAARATVIRASPAVDAASGTREFVLELAAGSRLRPGGTVTVKLGGESRRVVAIPAEALADSGYVLVWQEGRTTLRPVTLGARLPDGRFEVVGGLAAGERLAPARP